MSIPQTGGGQIENINQLTEYLESGCKPPKDWRIGTEHEKFGFNKDTLKPLPYEGDCSIKVMLENLRDTFDWAPVYEQGNLIGLEKNGRVPVLSSSKSRQIRDLHDLWPFILPSKKGEFANNAVATGCNANATLIFLTISSSEPKSRLT